MKALITFSQGNEERWHSLPRSDIDAPFSSVHDAKISFDIAIGRKSADTGDQ